jgi:hypothetical protein
LVLLAPAICSADLFTVSGFLNDPANSNLIGSGPWVGSTPPPPLFGNDNEIANNVAIYVFSVITAGTVNFDSNGFAAGGVDPYFTLFSSTGESAAFLDSSFFEPAGDFNMDVALAAGDYTVALGAFFNMSFAENTLGVDTLGDGFIGLGVPVLGNYYYELKVETLDGSVNLVPEPSWLGAVAMLGVGVLCRKRLAKRG